MAFTQRSAGTRAEILAAARQLLASKGYEGTTIRAVATEAGIDPSMVMRYYGSKEGLFAAAVDVDLQLPDAADWPRDEAGARLARHMVARWEGELSDELIILLLRSVGTNEAAAAAMRGVFTGQVARLVELIVGPVPDLGRRAGLLSTQMLGLALCRYVLELPPVRAMDSDTLAAMIAPVLQHYLFGDLDSAIPTDQRAEGPK
jgi:AcrR family transcriptional regulator